MLLWLIQKIFFFRLTSSTSAARVWSFCCWPWPWPSSTPSTRRPPSSFCPSLDTSFSLGNFYSNKRNIKLPTIGNLTLSKEIFNYPHLGTKQSILIRKLYQDLQQSHQVSSKFGEKVHCRNFQTILLLGSSTPLVRTPLDIEVQ